MGSAIFFRKRSHIITFEGKFSKIKILVWIELIKYKNKNFSITGTAILYINIKRVLNYCSKYWIVFNE